jgi:hypothetical protein
MSEICTEILERFFLHLYIHLPLFFKYMFYAILSFRQFFSIFCFEYVFYAYYICE